MAHMTRDRWLTQRYAGDLQQTLGTPTIRGALLQVQVIVASDWVAVKDIHLNDHILDVKHSLSDRDV